MAEKKALSTYEEFIRDPEQKKLLDIEYQELVLSELFLALMDEDQTSVRRLAKAAGVSPTIIQELRTGKKDNLTLKTFLLLINTLGYYLVLEKKPEQPLSRKKIGRKRRKIRFQLNPKPSTSRARKRRKKGVLQS
jgi:DNA-binding Xre family transcriptional regulator